MSGSLMMPKTGIDGWSTNIAYKLCVSRVFVRWIIIMTSSIAPPCLPIGRQVATLFMYQTAQSLHAPDAPRSWTRLQAQIHMIVGICEGPIRLVRTVPKVRLLWHKAGALNAVVVAA